MRDGEYLAVELYRINGVLIQSGCFLLDIRWLVINLRNSDQKSATQTHGRSS